MLMKRGVTLLIGGTGWKLTLQGSAASLDWRQLPQCSIELPQHKSATQRKMIVVIQLGT